MDSKDKFAIFHIEGGLGKHVAATAVAQAIKNNHKERKLIVVCVYPEMFLNLDFIEKVFIIGATPYFFTDYIQDKDTLIFKHEPYFTTEHILQKMPLIENWCKLYNLEYKGEKPIIEFNYNQGQRGNLMWRREKPILLLHTNGGIADEKYPSYSWARDMPKQLIVDIVNKYRNKYHIIQICKTEKNVVKGTEAIYQKMTNIDLFSLVRASEKRILIDSCLQHVASALNMKSTVLWITTKPITFGYKLHNNIIAKLAKVKLINSYLFDFEFTGEKLRDSPIPKDGKMFELADL